MFVGFGLFAPRRATAIAALVIGALTVSTSIFLIEELSHPPDGAITFSAEPMHANSTTKVQFSSRVRVANILEPCEHAARGRDVTPDSLAFESAINSRR